jgi:uncharacterized membrane protein (UPF0127 family)
MRVVDLDRGIEVASEGRVARTFWTRLRGLLGTTPLQPGAGLLLEPCNSIHMFFMSYPIDAIYLDARNSVLHVAANLAPWQIGPTVRHARRVLELPAGQAERCGVQPGDRLAFQE